MGKIEDLELLEELRQHGNITEMEFIREKQNILNTDTNKKSSAIYVVGLLLGIIAFLLSWIPFIGMFISLIAVFVNIAASEKEKQDNETNDITTVGTIFSGISLLLSSILSGSFTGFLLYSLS